MSVNLQLPQTPTCHQKSVHLVQLIGSQPSNSNSDIIAKQQTRLKATAPFPKVIVVVRPDVEELKWDPKAAKAVTSLQCPVPRCVSLKFSSLTEVHQHLKKLHPYHYHSKKDRGNGQVFRFCCPEKSCSHHADLHSFPSLPELKTHYFREHGTKKHACSKCGQTFGWEPDRCRHETKCGKDFNCPLCPASFEHEQALFMHRLFKHASAQESAFVEAAWKSRAAAPSATCTTQPPVTHSPGTQSPCPQPQGTQSPCIQSLVKQSPGTQSPCIQSLVKQSPGTQSLCTQSLVKQSQGTQSPCIQSLVKQSPGTQSPCIQSLVKQSPGTQSPCTQSPCIQSLVKQSPGTQSPCTQSPCIQSLVKQSPGTQSPCTQSPCIQSLVKQSPGTQSPCTQSPCIQSLVKQSPGTQSPCIQPLVKQSPGTQSPCIQSLVKQSPGTQSPCILQSLVMQSPGTHLAGSSGKRVRKVCPAPEELEWVPSQGGNKIVCAVPGCKAFPFKQRAGLSRHMAAAHKETCGIVRKICCNHLSNWQPPPEELWHFHCPSQDCNYHSRHDRYFTSFAHLRYHYVNTHSEKQFACQECGKQFGWQFDRDSHEKECKHVFSCDTCQNKGDPKIYPSRRALLTHCSRLQHPVPERYSKSSKAVAVAMDGICTVSETSTPATTTTTTSPTDSSGSTELAGWSPASSPAKRVSSPRRILPCPSPTISIPPAAVQFLAQGPLLVTQLQDHRSGHQNDQAHSLQSAGTMSGYVNRSPVNSVQIQTDFVSVSTAAIRPLASRGIQATLGDHSNSARVNIGTQLSQGFWDIGVQALSVMQGLRGTKEAVHIADRATQVSVDMATNSTQMDALAPALMPRSMLPPMEGASELHCQPAQATNPPAGLCDMAVQTANQRTDMSHMATQASCSTLPLTDISTQIVFTNVAGQNINSTVLPDTASWTAMACLPCVALNRAYAAKSSVGTQIVWQEGEGQEADTATQTALTLIPGRTTLPGQTMSTQTSVDQILLTAKAKADVPMAKSPGRKSRSKGYNSPIRRCSTASSEVQTSDCFPPRRKKRRMGKSARRSSASCSIDEPHYQQDLTIATQTQPCSTPGGAGYAGPCDPTVGGAVLSVQNPTLSSSALSEEEEEEAALRCALSPSTHHTSNSGTGTQDDLEEFLSLYSLSTAELGVQTQDDLLSVCRSEFGVQTATDILADSTTAEFGVQTSVAAATGVEKGKDDGGTPQSHCRESAPGSSRVVKDCMPASSPLSFADCGTLTEVSTLDSHTQTTLVSSPLHLDQCSLAYSEIEEGMLPALPSHINPRLFDSFDSDLSFSNCGTGTEDFFNSAHTQTISGLELMMLLDSGSDNSQMSVLDCTSQAGSVQSQLLLGVNEDDEAMNFLMAELDSDSSGKPERCNQSGRGVSEIYSGPPANQVIVQTYDCEDSFSSSIVSVSGVQSEQPLAASLRSFQENHLPLNISANKSFPAISSSTSCMTGDGGLLTVPSTASHFSSFAGKETHISLVSAADMHTQTADDLLEFLMTNMETQTTECLDEEGLVNTTDNHTQTSQQLVGAPVSSCSPGRSVSIFDSDCQGFNFTTAETQTFMTFEMDYENGLDGDECFDIVDTQTQTI